MRQILFEDDVVNVINGFLEANKGDEDTEKLIIAIGAELLDVSDDEYMNVAEEVRG